MHHFHDATLFEMGVQFDLLRGGRGRAEQAVIGVADILDEHEGCAGFGGGAGAAGVGVEHVDFLRQCGHGKDGRGKGRQKGGFEGHGSLLECLYHGLNGVSDRHRRRACHARGLAAHHGMAAHRHSPYPPLWSLPEAKCRGRDRNDGKTGQAIRAEMLCGHRLSVGIDGDSDRTPVRAEHDLPHRLRAAARHRKALAGEGQNQAEGQGQYRVQWSHRSEV